MRQHYRHLGCLHEPVELYNRPHMCVKRKADKEKVKE